MIDLYLRQSRLFGMTFEKFFSYLKRGLEPLTKMYQRAENWTYFER